MYGCLTSAGRGLGNCSTPITEGQPRRANIFGGAWQQWREGQSSPEFPSGWCGAGLWLLLLQPLACPSAKPRLWRTPLPRLRRVPPIPLEGVYTWLRPGPFSASLVAGRRSGTTCLVPHCPWSPPSGLRADVLDAVLYPLPLVCFAFTIFVGG